MSNLVRLVTTDRLIIVKELFEGDAIVIGEILNLSKSPPTSRFSAFVLKIAFLLDLTSSICRDDRTSDLKPKAAIRLIKLEEKFCRHSSFSLFLGCFLFPLSWINDQKKALYRKGNDVSLFSSILNGPMLGHHHIFQTHSSSHRF